MDVMVNTSVVWPLNATVGYNITQNPLLPNDTAPVDIYNFTRSTNLSLLVTDSPIFGNENSTLFSQTTIKDIAASSTKVHKKVEPGFPITYLSDNAAKSTPPRLHGMVKQFDKIPQDILEDDISSDQRLSKGHMAAAVVSSVCIFVLVVIMWIYCRKPYSYQKIHSDESSKYEYIYKPLAGGGLDDEYENTFVGVSIPLLQDNSKV